MPHEVCQFHVLHEVNKAVLSAVAQELKRLAAGALKLPRGRPSSKAAKRALRQKRIEQKAGSRWQRYLFVEWRLSLSERRTLQRISRGLPQLDLRTDNASFSQVGPFDEPLLVPRKLGFTEEARRTTELSDAAVGPGLISAANCAVGPERLS